MIVAVCGASVPDVCDVLEVVAVEELDVVECAAVDVEVVVAEFVEDGLLEHAASARAQAGRIKRRIDHVRNGRGMARV